MQLILAGIDDAESECGLDGDIEWDVVITNDADDNDDQLNTEIDKIIQKVTIRVSQEEERIIDHNIVSKTS